MNPAILSLFLAAGVSAGCVDSLSMEDAEIQGSAAITPDEAPEDSCAWENPTVQNFGMENESDRELSRASLSMTQTPGSSMKSTIRHRAESKGWSHRIELREDSLTRRQLGWRGNGWHFLAGDMSDTTMPLLPLWLPRRSLPNGWKAASEPDALFPATSIPQGVGAGVTSGKLQAYAVSAWDPVQTGNVPPWEKPWELHHIAAGAAISLPWIASLNISETRVSRSGQDSTADELIALGLASPHKLIELDGAWSSTRQNPSGGLALGAKMNQTFANSSRLEITLRQRNSDWTSSWDPTYSSASTKDSSAWGAGEAIASLTLPFRIHDGKALAKSEAWMAWNPKASTRKEGMRSDVEWHRKDVHVELRGLYRQWITATGYQGFHDFLSLETGLGRFPEWRTGVYRMWDKNSTRQGMSFAVDMHLTDLHLRPGVQLESNKNQELSGVASLWLHWKLSGGWTFAANGAAPCGSNLALNQMRWQAALNYAGR